MELFISTMLVSFFSVLKKYTEFSGRASRKEFWMFMLCNFIIGVVFGILGRIPIIGILFKIVLALFTLAVLIPSIAVGIRRLHDTNRSGFFLLLALIPGPGIVVVLTLCALEGTSGENQYGPIPQIE